MGQLISSLNDNDAEYYAIEVLSHIIFKKDLCGVILTNKNICSIATKAINNQLIWKRRLGHLAGISIPYSRPNWKDRYTSIWYRKNEIIYPNHMYQSHMCQPIENYNIIGNIQDLELAEKLELNIKYDRLFINILAKEATSEQTIQDIEFVKLIFETRIVAFDDYSDIPHRILSGIKYNKEKFDFLFSIDSFCKNLGSVEFLLSQCCSTGQTELTKRLLKYFNSGRTSSFMKIAIKNMHMDIIQLLIDDNRYDVNHNNNAILEQACVLGNIEIARKFIYDDNLILTNNKCIELAASKGHLEILKMFSDRSRIKLHNINIKYNNQQILCSAAKAGKLHIGFSPWPD